MDLKRDIQNLSQLIIGLSIIVALSFIQSCHKIETQYPENWSPTTLLCDEVPDPEWLEYDEIGDDLNVIYPTVNPENRNEIIFVRSWTLYIHNRTTGNSEPIFSGILLAPPQWSRQNWILLNHEGNIWKIRSDGSDLTQLTTNGTAFGGVWDYSGAHFVFRDNSINQHIICNSDGTKIDTIFNSPGEFNPDGEMARIMNSEKITQIGHVSVFNDQFVSVQNVNSDLRVHDVVWGREFESLIWSADDGIHETELSTGQSKTLISSCSAKVFRNPSKDESQQIYWTLIDQSLLDASTLYVKRRLYSLSSPGHHLELVEIP